MIDRDPLILLEDMPKPLTDDGKPNPDFAKAYVKKARPLGKAVSLEFWTARGFIEGKKQPPQRDWDALADRQQVQLKQTRGSRRSSLF